MDNEIKQIIEANTQKVIVAPWNGNPMPVTIIMLSSVALNACGDFSTVDVKDEEALATTPERASIDSMLKIKNIHESILRSALVHPTFDEIMNLVLGMDFVKQRKEELAQMHELVKNVPLDLKQKYLNEIDRLEILLSFLLPEDFMTFIVEYVIQRKNSDVDKLSYKLLLEAGFLAEKYSKRPSEFIEGLFTEKQKVDIDVAALGFVKTYRDAKQLDKSTSKTRWIRGGKKKHG